jgi:hypothetical protein
MASGSRLIRAPAAITGTPPSPITCRRATVAITNWTSVRIISNGQGELSSWRGALRPPPMAFSDRQQLQLIARAMIVMATLASASGQAMIGVVRFRQKFVPLWP